MSEPEDLPTRRYYDLNPLPEHYESLGIVGKPPLFILKDAWDDKPRPKGRTKERYHQVLDTRTRLQLLLYSKDELTKGAHGMVEWTDRSVEDTDNGKVDEEEDSDSVGSVQSQEPPKPGFENDMALLHADIAGWNIADNEDEEVLSIYSSENEENPKDTEPSVKVYYPLLPNPGHCTKQIRERLRGIAGCHDTSEHADLRELAAQMLAEIERFAGGPSSY
ncbi:hypothetical protein FRC12_013161 [Ceratobasidium sp. 428]|nr:hypothetical protein FRC12_013161 [Ceratobasidium sp. 428]